MRAERPERVEARYVARQAILDRDQRVAGYELLFRDGPENVFRCESIARATSRVIADSFLMIGLDTLTSGEPAYVNFSRESLDQNFAFLLPPRRLVVELLESVVPDAGVLRACKRLKAAGYTIALDDFAWSDDWRPILELADIVKIDFLATRGREREQLLRRLRPYRARLLAEKVETRASFDDALRAGFSLFQGFFFSRPVIAATRDLEGFESLHLRILEAVASSSCDLRTIEDLVRRDLALTYKILRRANSPVFGRPTESTSLRNALALLGLDEVRKWVALLLLAGLARGRPAELVRAALLRARFCEEVAPHFGLGDRATDLFLVGLFSELETMLGRSMSEILAELAFAPDLERALRREPSVLAEPLRCALAWERGDWATIDSVAETLAARGDGLPESYVSALEWLRESHPLAE
jgi:EAL and modified HD-GYP domain-containing signal transduction protein